MFTNQLFLDWDNQMVRTPNSDGNGASTPTTTNQATSGPSITFATRLEHAFTFKKQPAAFDDLLNELIAICEPKAAPHFAKVAANRRYIGPTSIAGAVQCVYSSLWARNPEARVHAREYVASLARVADRVDSFDEEAAE